MEHMMGTSDESFGVPAIVRKNMSSKKEKKKEGGWTNSSLWCFGLIAAFLILMISLKLGEESFDPMQEKIKDQYEVLGLSSDASPAMVKKKYFQLAKKFHPDLNPDCADCHDRFIEIKGAYKAILGMKTADSNIDEDRAMFESYGYNIVNEINKRRREEVLREQRKKK